MWDRKSPLLESDRSKGRTATVVRWVCCLVAGNVSALGLVHLLSVTFRRGALVRLSMGTFLLAHLGRTLSILFFGPSPFRLARLRAASCKRPHLPSLQPRPCKICACLPYIRLLANAAVGTSKATSNAIRYLMDFCSLQALGLGTTLRARIREKMGADRSRRYGSARKLALASLGLILIGRYRLRTLF